MYEYKQVYKRLFDTIFFPQITSVSTIWSENVTLIGK